MLTVDFDRLGLRPGDRVLDMGCGAGRHAFEMYRRGGDVIAFDQDGDELAGVLGPVRRDARRRRGARSAPRPTSSRATRCRCRSPTASSTGWSPPRCSSTSRTTRRDRRAGAGAAPRRHDRGHRAALAAREDLLGALDAYHEVEGGHVRIYTGHELVAKLQAAGLVYEGRDHVHGLHSPYWWLKCAVGVDNDEHPLVQGLPPGAGLGHHAHAALASPGWPSGRSTR